MKRDRSGLALTSATVAAVLAFYAWTAWTSGGLPPARVIGTDYYSELVHGLLKGHLYLDVPVDPAMQRAKDPYAHDVWRNHGWMGDASYYHGRYYLYFGVVPALLLLAPFRLLTGTDLWIKTAVFYFAAAAFVALAAYAWRVRRDCFPRSRRRWIVPSVLAIGLNPGVLSLIRRPWIYELPTASGLLFLGLMLHALHSALRGRRPALSLAAAGLCLALAAGSRPPFVLAAPAALAALAEVSWRRRNLRPLLGFAATFGAAFALLLAYNATRFGNPLEFGLKYQLTDPPASQLQFQAARYVPYNVRAYFLNGLDASRRYPFLQARDVGAAPAGYFLTEWVYGLARYAPTLGFLAGLFWLWRGPGALPARRATGAILLGAWAGPLLFDLTVQSAAIRYLTDFEPAMLVAAAVGWLGLEDRFFPAGERGGSRRLAAGIGGFAWTAAALISAGVASVYSFGLYGTIVEQRGSAFFSRVARRLNEPGFWYERLRGWHYGPVTLNVTLPSSRDEQVLIATPEARLVEDQPRTGEVRVGLRLRSERVDWSAPFPAGPGPHLIAASFGSLYPAYEHSYWLKHAFSPHDRCATVVEIDGHRVLKGFNLLPEVDCRDIAIAGQDPLPGPHPFSGRVLGVWRNRLVPRVDFDRLFEPWTLRFTVPAPGRWPLLSVRQGGTFSLVYVESEPRGRLRVGYAPTGAAKVESPWLSTDPGQSCRITLGMEALSPSSPPAGTACPLWIEGPEGTFWRTTAPTPAGPADEVRLGENPGRVAACAARIPGGVARKETPPEGAPGEPDQDAFLKVVLPSGYCTLLREPLWEHGVPGAADELSIIHYDQHRLFRFVWDHAGRGPVLEGRVCNADPDQVHEIEFQMTTARGYTGTRREVPGHVRVWFDGVLAMDSDTPVYLGPVGEGWFGENPAGLSGEPRFRGTILMHRWLRSR